MAALGVINDEPPVFFDRGGKRWRRVVVGISCMVLALACSIALILPSMAQSVWKTQINQDSGYPQQLLDTADVTNIPLLGGGNASAFHRIATVQHKGGFTYLKDPFSDTVFRQVTEAEKIQIGESPYIMEAFGRPADKQLMLTFDDGPDAKYTSELLDLLSREKVPATFFVVGQAVLANPELFKRLVREGHMAANHTLSHIDLSAGDTWRNRQEIIGTDRIMRAADNYATRLFRIPGGDPENNPLPLLQSQQLGYINVDFDIDTLDWQYQPGESIPVPKLDGEGHIVLMHDAGGDRTATLAMVEELIHQAKAQGYTFSTVQPLLPAEYVPVKLTSTTFADEATYTAFFSFLVTPGIVVTWLFWFGLGSLTIMSLLYVVLALINNQRYKKRKWVVPPDEALPFVSVILPVFNEEPVVRRTLDALRASDYPSFEVVAVNDGSTDDTLAIMQQYAKTWPRLRVIDQPNGGKSAASNNGIAHAKGEIIVTLDGDTIFEPQTIRMFARHFTQPRNGKPIGAVAGHVKVGNRCNVLTVWQSLEYISGICVTRMAEGMVGAISIVPGACAAWSKHAMIEAGMYSHSTLAEDADLTLKIQEIGYSVVQENAAVAWTEAPEKVKGLAKQRLRWTYGNIQAMFKHHRILFRPRYGALGMVTMPYALVSVLVPLIFMPFTIIVAGVSIAQGNWQSVVYFWLFVAGIHWVISIVAIAMVHESWWHLAVVPIYRVIYEPLRAYLIYAAFAQALKGRAVGWYKPERTNSVNFVAQQAT